MKRFIVTTVLVAAACHDSPSIAQNRAELPSVSRIDRDRVYTLLPPDAIPSIDEPRFVTAAEATFMHDDEPVIGLVAGGVPKAYSTWHLDHHEIVNDVTGGQPVAVTW